MAVRRDFPYVWATWLPRLLTGENSCEWAVWFKAHYQNWDKRPSDFNQAEWLRRHTTLLNEQRDFWLERGYNVRVENQNGFRLRGATATLAGKPDLIAVRGDRALIIEVKTGREQTRHRPQILTYMYALPRTLDQYRGVMLGAEIIYPERTVKVPPGSVHMGFVDDLGALICRVAADEAPKRVPSAQECRFCDITAEDCPDRMDAPADTNTTAQTDDF